jgi:UDP-N-acetylmuramoyl-tripeptide--D-alanyl-D-alanine ligase
MRSWDAAAIARAAAARVAGGAARGGGRPGPLGASIDSRRVCADELFVGLRGEQADGGEHAAQALAAGAWGVLVRPEHVAGALETPADAIVLSHPDPLVGLQSLARAWRDELQRAGARVVAITGSTGKTSTKDILAALLAAHRRVLASPANHNTEIGLPLAVLAAPGDTEVLVLEMAMRGAGQIAELTEIAAPDVGVIVNVGPVHLELLGSLEAVAAAKAELIAGLRPGASLVVPAGEALLAPHLREDLRTLTFGAGGDVTMEQVRRTLRPSFAQAHNLANLLAAVAAARALGIEPQGEVRVSFSELRGEHVALPGGVTLINDCYNANPMSMRAALDDLAETAPGRRVAVLGDMLELGADARSMHVQVGRHASARGVELLMSVGSLAAEMRAGFDGEMRSVPDALAASRLLPQLLREGDTVLVKGSRGMRLEAIAQSLLEQGEPAGQVGARGTGSVPAGPRR